MSTVARLWTLQITDLAVDSLRRRLAGIEHQLGETPELPAARQAVAESQAELDEWRSKQRRVEQEVRDLTAHIRSAEKQLMSGRVRNPKELAGMQANVAALKRHRGTLEDTVLEAMLEVERCQEELAEHQTHLAQVENNWQVAQPKLQAQKQQATTDLKAQTTRLKQQWEATSPQDRELYRNLRSRKAGRALALVERNACQACGVGLPTSIIQQIRRGDERVFCPTCGRLLHSQA